MAYFEGVGGSGGSIVVTCDSEFAGSTISCSDGTNTMTAVCPSVSPYEVEFMVSDSGTYEISATVSGTTYTTEVVVDLELEAALKYGFSWPRWVTYGGLDPSDYEDLVDVFSDEAAVRRLMTVHASADYLITCVTDYIDTIDDFTANDTAMKWIGLRDYVCDGLIAITGVEAKFLASEYWERYLKDHVPVMTGANAPYGTVSSSNSTNAINVFDQNESTIWTATSNGTNQYVTYKFTNPVCVKKARLYLTPTLATSRPDRTFYVRASNDGTNYVNIGSCSVSGISSVDDIIDCSTNEQYYLYYQIFCADIINVTNSWAWGIRELQFYGRSLNVSVPVMTSNTAPYGEASANTGNSNAYKAFDNNDSNIWEKDNPTSGDVRLAYKFTSPTEIRKALLYNNAGTGTYNLNVRVDYSDDGTTWSEGPSFVSEWHQNSIVDIPNVGSHLYWSFYFVSTTTGVTSYFAIPRAQFYGLDYSEKEFETGTTKKWLYDHGVEVVAFNFTSFKQGTSVLENDGNYLRTGGGFSANQGRELMTDQKVDVSNNDFVMARFGDEIVGQEGLEISSDKPTSYSTMGTYRLSNVTVPRPINHLILSINISSINQDVIIGIGSRSTGAVSLSKTTISELWLE